MTKTTAINLLQNYDNFIIVIDSIEGAAGRELRERYYNIINRKYDKRYTADELEKWKRFYMDALSVKILRHV